MADNERDVDDPIRRHVRAILEKLLHRQPAKRSKDPPPSAPPPDVSVEVEREEDSPTRIRDDEPKA